MIGLVISTELEAALLLAALAGQRRLLLQGKEFYTGLVKEHHEAALCLCGVGKTNAAHGTTLLIERFKPALVYSLGVAGAYPSSGLGIGAVALAEKEIYGDEGLLLADSFYPMERIGLPLVSGGGTVLYNEFPMVVPAALRGSAPQGTFVTVSSCSGSRGRGRELEQRFAALCETMEGASVAHVCALAGVPCAEVRGISNIIEDRAARSLSREDIAGAAEAVQRFFLEKAL